MNELLQVIIGVVVPAAISVFTLYKNRKNREADRKKTESESDKLEQEITERILKLANDKLIEYEKEIANIKANYEKEIKQLRNEVAKLQKDIGVYKRNQTRLIKTIGALLDQMKEEGITPVVVFDLTELEETD